MAVKIRFARIGKKHAPVYRIVAVDSRKKRDGRYLENLGTYNPLTKEIIQFHDDRIAYWISVGAVVADSVQRLIKVRKKQEKTVQPKAEKATKAVAKKPVADKKTVAAPKAKAESKASTSDKVVEKKEAKPSTAKKSSTKTAAKKSETK